MSDSGDKNATVDPVHGSGRAAAVRLGPGLGPGLVPGSGLGLDSGLVQGSGLGLDAGLGLDPDLDLILRFSWFFWFSFSGPVWSSPVLVLRPVWFYCMVGSEIRTLVRSGPAHP